MRCGPRWRAGGLDEQEVVVHERPRPLHSTCVEVVVEGSDVRVSEDRAVQVVWLWALSIEEIALVEAGVSRQRALRQGAGLSCGPRPGTAVLDEQVLDALNCRMVSQVTTTRPCHPLRAHGIGAQSAAVTSVHHLPAKSSSPHAAEVQRRSHKL